MYGMDGDGGEGVPASVSSAGFSATEHLEVEENYAFK